MKKYMASRSAVAVNNRRMLENTFVLYVRMACTMALGFFTTRELLVALGVIDFGLANVIGSVVLMFSFLSGTMQATVSRFYASEIGLKDLGRLKNTFNLTLLIYILIVVLILVLAASIGLWFFENTLSIAAERRISSFWFYCFSVVAFMFNVISVPYSALIISHENVKTFAWIGTGESLGRLCIVYLLYFGGYDRLALYGLLLAIIALLTFTTYFIYCYRTYPESHPKYYWDKSRCLEMLSFAAWNLWGALSGLFSNVFVNILLNNYFGPVVNAARGIAMQGATGVSSFVTNFLTAARPQIFKYYAEGNRDLAVDLSMKSARAGFFLLFLFSLPVLLEMPFVLGLWLAEVPTNADLFMRLILVQRLIEIVAYPLVTLSQACGRVALYQTVVGVLQWTIFPISWAVFESGYDAESVFWIGIALSVVALFAQFYLITLLVSEFSISRFIREAVYPSILVSIASAILPAATYYLLPVGMLRLITVCTSSFVFTVLSIYMLGLDGDERDGLRSYVLTKIRRGGSPG